MIIRKVITSIRGPTIRKIHQLISINEVNSKDYLGKRTKIQGWVRAMRKMKENIFLDLNDGSTHEHLQVVVKKDLSPGDLGYGSCVSIAGKMSVAPNGRIEMQAEDLNIIGQCDLKSYPFLPRKQYSQEYIRQYLHLRPRTRNFASILRLRGLASSAVTDYMSSHQFTHIHTPILTSNDCEGAGEVFSVKPESMELIKSMQKQDQDIDSSYFDTKAYLTVSGQFHLETCARALSKVYTFGPTFRAENSKSRYHLSEFYMVEAEMAFIDDIQQLMDEIELFIQTITRNIIDKGAADLKNINGKEPEWLGKKFTCLTYDEAVEILEKNTDKFKIPIKHGNALGKEHELFLVSHNAGVPIFVINWPKTIKPFYMKECCDNPSKIAALDLLAPEVGEIVGGSLREDNYKKLKAKIPKGVDLKWYFELRKFGNAPTGGYGMGFERYIQTLLAIPNIKDVIPFPRWPHNCSL